MDGAAFDALTDSLRRSPALAAKADIGVVVERLGLPSGAIPVGDDCAAIADGDGHLLVAIEGFLNAFVAADPWFAGWCGVMVNISDIAAMGGRPLAVVDAVWADGEGSAAAILDGMKAASAAYGAPIVGGHTNLRTPQAQLAVAVVGRAGLQLLTSFDARPGDALIAAIDHRGAYREPFDNWQAALGAPCERLRGDLGIAALDELRRPTGRCAHCCDRSSRRLSRAVRQLAGGARRAVRAAARGSRAPAPNRRARPRPRRQGHQPGRHSWHRSDARRSLGRRDRH